MAAKKVDITTTPPPPVIKDFSIQVRAVDRSRKDLNRWRLALLGAENIVNPNRKLLYDLYADITLDEHLTSVMEQRRLPLTNASLTFVNDQGEVVPEVERLINTIAFELLLLLILDSKFFGYSLILCDFTQPMPVVQLVPRAHVVPQAGMVVESPGDPVGISYLDPPYTHLYVGVGEPHDLGLLIKAAPLVLLKRGNVSDWATFNEVFGQPIRIGKYGPGDPTQKAQLDQALDQMGARPWITIPEGADIQIESAAQTTSADTYSKLTSHLDGAISKLIVGQTMTTESGASLSQSEVHERVASKAGQSDRRFVLKVLEGFVKPLLVAQGIPAVGSFQFMEEEEDVSKKDRLTGDIEIHTKVGPLTKAYWATEYNVEFVDNADVLPDTETDEPITGNPEDEPDEGQPTEPDTPDPGTAQHTAPSLMDALRDFFGQAPIRSSASSGRN